MQIDGESDICNKEIYDMYRKMRISEFIRIKRLQWVGHVITMDEDCIPKEILQQKIFEGLREQVA